MTSKLYLTKRRNGYFYIGFFEGNHRKWKTTKCTTKSDALQFHRTFEGTKKETERTPLLSELLTRFESMRGNSIRPCDLILFAALSGLRLSEILNLKWSAVDFEKLSYRKPVRLRRLMSGIERSLRFLTHIDRQALHREYHPACQGALPWCSYCIVFGVSPTTPPIQFVVNDKTGPSRDC